MTTRNRFAALLVCGTFLLGASLICMQGHAQQAPAGTVHLFNGKDLSGFYTFIKDRGKDTDPKKVFTVTDGILRISGEELGCITSNEEFENYRLIAEYKWGEKTWAPRVDKARDSGILLHSIGADGAYGGIWMNSIECQLIEGGSGDFIVVGDNSDTFAITSHTAPEKVADCYVYQPGGKPATINGGRINWFGRDPGWQDVKNFRGAKDVEKPIGEWNTYECVVEGNTIKVLINGVLVNECYDVKPCKGRIQIQSEMAEIFFRRFDIEPLPKH
ncbi:MAG: DUF1080 domain-containing protein [Candidatus Hydrogenedentes bacterium]|nr:DUF1080 domain-containing protein [Candidatus Hydrogenedentota bacterium]